MTESNLPGAATQIVRRRGIAVLTLTAEESADIDDRPEGFRRFSISDSRSRLGSIRPPIVCLALIERFDGGPHAAFAGILRSKRKITTVDLQFVVRELQPISLGENHDLASVIAETRYRNDLRRRLTNPIGRVTPIPGGLASATVDGLLDIPSNVPILDELLSSDLLQPHRPNRLHINIQRNAIETALGMSGMRRDSQPTIAEVTDEDDADLLHVFGRLQEDAVIQHDARNIAGMELVESRQTGIARFQDLRTTLDVITANKLPLEELTGADLIFINEETRSVVLVQYKMLERNGAKWEYRPDSKFEEEIQRMNRIVAYAGTSGCEYRLSHDYCFLKLVKRTSQPVHAPIILPLEHYLHLRREGSLKGSRGGPLISYATLNGRYMREQPFTELIKDGYLGSDRAATKKIKELVREVLRDGRPAVVAVRRRLLR